MLKWIYNLGVQHERMRIKKLIAEFNLKAQHQYDMFNNMSERNQKRSAKDLDISLQAQGVLNRLIDQDPIHTEYVLQPAPIDRD